MAGWEDTLDPAQFIAGGGTLEDPCLGERKRRGGDGWKAERRIRTLHL